MKFSIHPTLILILTVCISCSNEKDSFQGDWEAIPYVAQELKIPDHVPTRKKPVYQNLRIRKIGTRDISYSISADGDNLGSFKVLNDTLLYRQHNTTDSIVLAFNPKNKTLRFLHVFDHVYIWQMSYNPDFKRVSSEAPHQQKDSEDNFFDYSISDYQSGDPKNYVPYQLLLPFKISNSFIQKRKIKELKIPLYLIETDGDSLGYTAIFTFNDLGNVLKIEAQFSKASQFWKFNRRDDENNSLYKIDYSNTGDTTDHATFFYDEDEWPVDKFNQKIVKYDYEWSMLDAYLPHTITNLQLQQSMEFRFNTKNQLGGAIMQQENKLEAIVLFEYHDQLLTKVTYERHD